MTDTFYAKDRRVYQFLNAAIDGAAVFGRFTGPDGKIGRVRGIEWMLTNSTTTSATEIIVGENGATEPAIVIIPVGSQFDVGAMTAAQVEAAGADEVAGVNDVILPADTLIEVESDGGADAGDADITITVDWF